MKIRVTARYEVTYIADSIYYFRVGTQPKNAKDLKDRIQEYDFDDRDFPIENLGEMTLLSVKMDELENDEV